MLSNRILSRALIFTALFFLSGQLIQAQLSNLETRCLWIVRESMYTKSSIDSAMVYAYKSNYDIVFVQVRGRGYAFYDSNIVPKHPNIKPDFDPLEFYKTVGNEKNVRNRLNSNVISSLRRVVGRVTLDELLSEKRSDIMDRIIWRILLIQ